MFVSSSARVHVRCGSIATEPFSASFGQCPLLLQERTLRGSLAIVRFFRDGLADEQQEPQTAKFWDLKRNEKAPARALGRGRAGASTFGMATQQNTYATRHPGYGLFRLRLRPRQQSGG